MTVQFVYVEGMRGPEAQVWHDAPKSGAGAPKKPPLQSVELPDDFAALTITQLETLYPYNGATRVA